MATLTAKDRATTKTGWDVRHNTAIGAALGSGMAVPISQEMAIPQMLRAWENYAKAHAKRFDAKIGEDYVLGPAWQDIGLGIRSLLNGESGRLDCGTLDAFILDTLSDNGIDTENL